MDLNQLVRHVNLVTQNLNFKLAQRNLSDSNPNAAGPRLITTGSDVVVIAKDTATGNIIRRVLTFCGNGVADAGEECDGTAFCNSECQCTSGTAGVNGRCGARKSGSENLFSCKALTRPRN